MLVAGIDEAGRGPCLGPMVMAVAVIEKEKEDSLFEIGARDSKELTPAKREELFPKIKKMVLEYKSVHISAEEIDKQMPRHSLNEIEAMHAAKLLNALKKKPEVVYVDSPDVLMAEFAKRIKKYIAFPVKIISEHKADSTYPIVSAASIIAKVERDMEIKKLSQEFGELGSGYSHDEVTIRFLKKYFHQHSVMPSFARKSWQTIKVLQNEKFQTKLFGGD